MAHDWLKAEPFSNNGVDQCSFCSMQRSDKTSLGYKFFSLIENKDLGRSLKSPPCRPLEGQCEVTMIVSIAAWMSFRQFLINNQCEVTSIKLVHTDSVSVDG